jgi:superfamily II DNA or RNA helicase
MKVEISNEIRIYPFTALPDRAQIELKECFSFANPAYLENERLGFSNWDTPERIIGYRIEGNAMIVPRGAITRVVGILRSNNVMYGLVDHRRDLPEVSFRFRGELRDYQIEAVKAMEARDFGVLCAPPGSGKTVAAAFLISRRRQPALIVVHTRELADQWISRLETFLGIPKAGIGMIGGGKVDIGEKVTVGIVNTVYQMAVDLKEYIGFLIVDECHRCAARTFSEAVSAFDSRYMLGLSATPYRRDRMTKMIGWHLGKLLHTIDEQALVDAGHILKAEVVTRRTDFLTRRDPRTEYSTMLSELTGDFDRNNLIANDVAREAGNGGGVCLVLTDRKNHAETLLDLLASRGVRGDLLTGDLPPSERRRVVEDLNAGRVNVLLATGQLIGEGFDCPALSTLFLATPIKFDGRLLQYLGRVLRPAPGKSEARVYDYLDDNVGVLASAARRRQEVYARKDTYR